MKSHRILKNYYFATALQLLVPLLLLWLSRFAFACYNADLTGNPSFARMLALSAGGLRFDLSAWAYFNIPFILLRFIPAGFVVDRRYIRVTDWIYCIANSALLLLSLVDIPFFRFTGSRLRLAAIEEMTHDPNITGIVASYTAHYWWVTLIALSLIVLLVAITLLLRPDLRLIKASTKWRSFGLRSILFAGVAFLTFCAMRGSLGAGRPLSIADAVWYARTPPETNIVLNTPFCILRSSDGAAKLEKLVFFTPTRLRELRSSLHTPTLPANSFSRKNIMLITIESGSKHFIDNIDDTPGCPKRHLMPFLDSLSRVSLVNTHVLATGKRSIEGITAIYGGFPTFGDMIFMSSPYNANTVDSHARLLRDKGYSSRFYFGGNHGSYSIDALAKAMGYNDVADRDTYADDSEFDGHWGIFDHAMARYAALDLTNLQEPFVAGWFTLDLHEPFATPAHWRPDGYRNPQPGPMRSAEYTDRALRQLFEIARTQPWYMNTIFIITGDHGCRDLKGTPYDGMFIQPHVMFMAYAPDGSIPPARIENRFMTQFDIGPTILGLLRYPEPYIAVGTDMMDSSRPHYALGFFNGQYQVTGPRYLITLTHDAKRIDKAFDIAVDPTASTIATSPDSAEIHTMLHWAQAFLQDYTERMNSDSLHR